MFFAPHTSTQAFRDSLAAARQMLSESGPGPSDSAATADVFAACDAVRTQLRQLGVTIED